MVHIVGGAICDIAQRLVRLAKGRKEARVGVSRLFDEAKRCGTIDRLAGAKIPEGRGERQGKDGTFIEWGRTQSYDALKKTRMEGRRKTRGGTKRDQKVELSEQKVKERGGILPTTRRAGKRVTTKEEIGGVGAKSNYP